MCPWLMRLSVACLLLLGAYAGHANATELSEISFTTPPVGNDTSGGSSFTISGQTAILVVVRGLGPSLSDSESLPRGRKAIGDPRITLFSGETAIASNDDWQDHPNADQIPLELQPAYAAESALALTLAPGDYRVAIEDSKFRRRLNAFGGVTVTRVDVPQVSGCPLMPQACVFAYESSDGSAVCLLDPFACSVDLEQVVTSVNEAVRGVTVTTASPMWFQAWGGAGGQPRGGSKGGVGGYAQTTTSVDDIKTEFLSTQLFYFLGAQGSGAGETCGGGGGAATIVTMEDLSLSPDTSPDGEFILLVAAGGGGGGGSDKKGLCANGGEHTSGAGGGVAIALQDANVNGSGGSSHFCTNQGCAFSIFVLADFARFSQDAMMLVLEG